MKPSLLTLFLLFSLSAFAEKKPKFDPNDSQLFNFTGLKKMFQPGPGSRACCTFGTNVKLVYFPFVRVDQTTGAEKIEKHIFGNKGKGKENQGEIFTCRAGFVDTSHIRHTADWTAYVAFILERYLPVGGRIPLVFEGGKRWLTIKKYDGVMSKENIISIAQRIAYDTTVWHEVLTWFVPAVIPIYSEKLSSFAPEDNFSNLLGTYLAAEALKSSKPYNEAMAHQLKLALTFYDGKDRATTQKAFKSIAGSWWDDKKALPNKWITLKRHLNAYYRVVPWNLPNQEENLGCDSNEEKVYLDVPREITLENGDKAKITDFYEMDMKAQKGIPVDQLLGRDHQYVSHRDLPELVEKVKVLIKEEYDERGIDGVFDPSL